MVSVFSLSTEYWTNLQITKQDVEYLHNHLFELETPLTAKELVTVLAEALVRLERDAAQKLRQAGGRTYLPKETYQPGEELVFPALNWSRGMVTALREGTNPELGAFDVLTVTSRAM